MKNKGITLIALVITIIVLLILAGISIQALTNTGLFAQAESAKRESEIANIKEQIQLDIYQKQLEPPLGSITEEQLKTILEKYFTDVPETLPDDLSTLTLITKSEYGSYSIKVSDIYTSSTTQGTQEDELLSDKVQVGDYVAYTPDSASTDAILDELTTYSGSTANTTSTLTQETGLKWRVLDVTNDGKVRLISATPTTQVTLSGYNGYNNAVYLLDKTCETLYSKAGYSENVQNLKIEDIQNKMSTDYTTIDSNYGTTFSPTNKKYPSIFAQEEGQTVNGTTGTLGLSKQTTRINQTTVNTASSWTVKYTYWNKTMAESDFGTKPIYYDLFIAKKNEDDTYSNYSTYWMSSRCVSAGSVGASFYVRVVNSDDVSTDRLYGSDDYTCSYGYALRPVITLNSNVLVKSGNGTSTSAYEI